MISNHMIQVAANTHQRELRRAAAAQRSAADHTNAAQRSSGRAQRTVAQLLHRGTSARVRRGAAVPRLSN